MGLFVCDKCHVIENTATGWYHSRRANQRMLGLEYPDGMAMCSACAPAEFSDGSGKNGTGLGKWHDHFKRNIATPEWIAKEEKQSCIYRNTKGALDVLNGIPPTVIFNENK